MKRVVKWLGIVLGIAIAALLIQIGTWYLRPNQAVIDPALDMEVWSAVADGWHNSNTDLTYWNGTFLLVHARSRYHMGNAETRLVVLRSEDAKTWEEIAELDGGGTDIRDPKFAQINGKLFLYALKNATFEPEPYQTVISTSSDGVHWQPWQDAGQEGWLFWRPKTFDGATYYVTAYWHEHGKSILLKSSDGFNWEFVSQIYAGDRNDETALEFLPDGRMLITARLEGDRAWHQGAADAATLLGVASPPYTDWQLTKSYIARLDGPALFSYKGEVYAVARFDPEGYNKWYRMSSLFGRKRTSLYKVTPEELIYLSDLPSSGDTSYPGVVLMDGYLYASYYTSDTHKDPAWLLALVLPSDILMAQIDLANIAALAASK